MQIDPFHKFIINSIRPGDWIFVSNGGKTLTIQVAAKLTDRIICQTHQSKSSKFVLHKAEYDRITGKMIDWWYKQLNQP